jgi:hypothetical protein
VVAQLRHEIAHRQARPHRLPVERLAPRAHCFGTQGNDLRSQGDVLRNDEVATAQALDDLVVGDVDSR